tara:strand:+ start:3967 stop:4077 length:111 start_codon:yes stop_codon:yes gene_type:complete
MLRGFSIEATYLKLGLALPNYAMPFGEGGTRREVTI